MESQKKHTVVSVTVVITFIIMLIMNILANALPLNNRGTGEISDAYPNLFAPAGITFSIWGLIYLLLFVYSIYQFLFFNQKGSVMKQAFHTVGVLFSISSVANAAWIFAWHYDVIWLSVILIVFILFCLIRINLYIKDKTYTKRDYFFVKLPFVIYFGWITIATVANITVFLVSVKWDRFSLSEIFWTDLMILVSAGIGFFGVLFYRSIAYGLVLIWAFGGIAYKHFSPSGYDRQYPSVLLCVVVAILIILSAQIRLSRNRSGHK